MLSFLILRLPLGDRRQNLSWISINETESLLWQSWVDIHGKHPGYF